MDKKGPSIYISLIYIYYIFLYISFSIHTEAMNIKFGDPKSIIAKWAKMALIYIYCIYIALIYIYILFFVDISFSIHTEAMNIKFGDPKSIIVEFHFSGPKKWLKKIL